MKSALLVTGTCALLLSGCATSHLTWGSYPQNLYQLMLEPERQAQSMAELRSHLAFLEARERMIPPGLYAELGTLYLAQGDNANAITAYQRERYLWPDSAPLMTQLITALAEDEQ